MKYSVKIFFILMGLFTGGILSGAFAQTTIINPLGDGGFETGTTFAANGWTSVNDGNNKWYVGAYTKCNGSRAAYIDINGTAGAANTYNKGAYRTSHFYRNVTFPAGQSSITLTFNYKGIGEGVFDYMQVFLVDIITTPVAGTELPIAKQIGLDYYNLTSTCTAASITIPGSNAGLTKRLVFSWSNDNSGGTDPAIMVDDISLISNLPPPPPANDDPCNAIALTVGATCSYNTFTNLNASGTSGVPDPSCSSYLGGDVWFTAMTSPTGTISFDSNTGGMIDGGMAVYTGTCGALTEFDCNDDGSVNGAMPALSLSGLPPSTIVYVRFWSYDNDNNGTFQLCAFTPTPPVNDNQCNAIQLPVNASCTYLTYTNQYATPALGVADPSCANYLGGDVWFKAIVPGTGVLSFDSNTGAVTDGGMAVYSGTCGALTEITCDDDNSINGLMPAIAMSGLNPGDTIWVRFWEKGNDNNGTFKICASTFSVPANDNPCTATAVTVNNACVYTQYTNLNATATTGVLDPICSNYLGGDVWFTTTIPSSGLLIIDSNTGVVTDGGMAAYVGSCGSLTEIACDDDLSNNGLMPMLNISTIAAGTQIWVRFWENGNNNNGTFSLCFYNPCNSGGPPANDACANATPLILGVTASGSNTCAGSTGEPAAASCWSVAGTMNTVWYTVVCPASQKISIRTGLGTLTNTQIQVFSGNCGALTSIGCGENLTLCSETQYWSEVVLTGLVAGAVYYIRVDGYGGATGDFNITAIDGNSTWPIVFGQDCGNTVSVCSATLNVGNPGFVGSGNYCDYNGSNGTCPSCILVGERNSVWYSFTTNATGTLQFLLTPKALVDYDFSLWDITGAANYCASVAAGTLKPVRCSYAILDGDGSTGMVAGSGDKCETASGNRFVDTMNVVSGQSFLLLISNFSSSTFVGYDLNFGASPINFAINNNTLTWTGGTNSSWNDITNWGGCSTPDCSKDLVIYGGPSNQPSVPAGTTVNCKNVIIQPGASLTLGATAVLDICGNFINYGNFNAASGSIVKFANGNVNQQIDGNLTSTNSFGGVTVLKTGGAVSMLQNADMKGDFIIGNNTSAFDAGGKYHKVAGHFTNNGGVYTPGTGTLEFSGALAQNYLNNGILNNVMMKHNGSGVTLQSNMVIGSTGNLTLTSGKLITSGAYEVQITNPASAAVSSGLAISYVEGALRRYINATGSYDFPVGNAAKGFQRANINFAYPANPTSITNILAQFQSYASVPVALGALTCAMNFSSPALDNGKWIFSPTGTSTSGNFDLTLYNLSYGNAQGGWTIMSDFGSGWGIANGSCAASVATAVKRTGMNGLNGSFGTAQSPGSLPVELVSLKAKAQSSSITLSWSTASEKDNMGFRILRSTGNEPFGNKGWVQGGGNSSSTLNYQFEDNDVEANIPYYYRLQQEDFNGERSLSKIVVATIQRNSFNFSISPNPFHDETTLTYFLVQDAKVEICIINSLGQKTVLQKEEIQNSGENHFKINRSEAGLKSGMYIILLKISETITRIRMVVGD
jgi:hypothetical protein